MKKKVGILVFTHGSRLKEGNEVMLQLVEQLRERLGYDLIEACFMELGKPLIPVAIKKLVQRGANHIFGYAFFLVPGSHLKEDIPFIFEQTLKKHPGVTYELSPPMMSDPMMVDFVAQKLKQALA
ncbi:MAG TPA: CbiX/SirB N-terminal domain-containing protein [Verrucomicrobiae bacterium]|nr:CbiX/SirB N-terminal domain-containing protein [Verrucomicrobiae bacterium]